MSLLLHLTGLLLLVLCSCHLASCQAGAGGTSGGSRQCSIRVYNVAVEKNETLVFLKSISEVLTPRNTTALRIVFNFTYFPISPLYSSPGDMVLLETELLARNIYAVVAEYYLSLAVVTYSNGIPYFIGNQNEYSSFEYQTQMFQYQIDHNQLNSTLFDLNAALLRQGYNIITDGTKSSSYFTANVAGKLFTQKVINASTTDEDIFATLVNNKNLLTSHSWVLVYMPENMGQIERIFNQSGPAGVLTDSDIFIIPSLEEKQQYLANIRQSYAVVYTFLMEGSQRYNKKQLDQTFLKDCFMHFVAAISSCQLINSPNYTLVAALLNVTIKGDSGFYGYRRGIRYGLTINVMTTDRTKPVDNFMVKSGAWVQDGNPAYKADYFKTSSIKNSLIRFAGVIDKPYLYRDLSGQLTGISYDLIQLMQKNLQFQYELIFVPDEEYGVLQADGNWTGIVRYLLDNKADMSANFLSLTSDRTAVIDSSINLVQSGLLMLMKRSIHQLDFLHVFYPFSWYVWISIVFSMIVLSITLFVSDKISPNTSGKSMFSFLESFFLVFSSFLMSKVETEPRKPSARLFTLLLWFSTLFYMTTYVSNLVPFLVKPDESVPFSSIAELQNATAYRPLFINNTLEFATAKRRWPGLVQRASVGWPEEMAQPSMSAAVELVKAKDRYVLIDSATSINYQKTKNCSLKAYGPLEEVQYESIMMSKSFAFKAEVRAFLNSIRYSDYQNLEKKYFSLNRCPTSIINPADKLPLDFNYFAGLFAAVGIGSILGFLYIILHWVYRKVSLWMVRRRGKVKLRYGETYDSEILKINKEGVWVKIEGRQEVFFIANNSLHSDPTKIKNAKALNMRVRQKIKVQYFGRDSATDNRIFARLHENSEWLIAERNRDVDEDSD